MGLKLLKIENLRIIRNAKLEPAANINIICGGNAAGKTTLLEAIDILSRGRSFRTNVNSHLINRQSSAYRIYAQLSLAHNKTTRVGIEWSKGERKLRLDGSPVYKQSTISKLFPVRTLNPQGSNIVSGSPKQKRSHIDWGVFHVKPDFNETLLLYRRVLSQKNLSLKNYGGVIQNDVWNDALTTLARRIDAERSSYVSDLNACLSELNGIFQGDMKLTLEYRRGWHRDADFGAVLKTRFPHFERLGFVDSGPHTADYEILLDGKPAKIYASGGQQKLISATFIMAQVKLLEHTCGKTVTFLVDDLPSELDLANRKILLHQLNSWNVQVFVTTHDLESVPVDMLHDYKLFHVKQGAVQGL